MPKGNLSVAKSTMDIMTPECSKLLMDFIGEGEMISCNKVRDEYIYLLNHPDFDSDKYGEDAEYILHYSKKKDEWHNPYYVLSKLSVWTKDYKVEDVKRYDERKGVVYDK